MVTEEPLNGGEDDDGAQEEPEGEVEEAPTEEVVTFGEDEGKTEEVIGFMLKTLGEVEQQLATFEPEERETSVDAGEEVQLKEEEEQAAKIPVIVSEELSDPITGEAEVPMDTVYNETPSLALPSCW